MIILKQIGFFSELIPIAFVIGTIIFIFQMFNDNKKDEK